MPTDQRADSKELIKLSPEPSQVVQRRRIPRRRIEEREGMAGTGEEPGQGVIIPGRDRVELVVVAAGTTDGQAEEGLAQDVHLIVDPRGAILAEVDGRMRPLVEPEKARSQDRLVRAGRWIASWVGEEVAGHLLDDKLVVGQVLVERPDQVVSVAVGERDVVIELVPRRFGEPDQVHPVPRPALAVVRRSKQTVDHPGERLSRRGRVVLKRRNLLGSRREADEVERRAADQGGTVSVGGGGEPGGFEFGQDEPVDVVVRPGDIPDAGRLNRSDRLPAPVLGPFRKVEGPDLAGAGVGSVQLDRPRRARLDPSSQGGDLVIRKL